MEGGPPGFQRDFSCPAVLRFPDHPLGTCFAYGALTLSRGPSQAASARLQTRAEQVPLWSYNPEATRTPVWAGPLSLAATQGISVDFFSWGYLDVSVLPVGSALAVTAHDGRRVAPFGNPGITACVRLPQDYRGLPRPSSPVRAKASTVRPSFAWPDCLRPHSKARLPLFRGRRTRRKHSWCFPYPTTLPHTRIVKKPSTEECFASAPESGTIGFESFLLPSGSLLAALKEVIQPQVPLRLPCYDFAPVTELAFGGSLR